MAIPLELRGNVARGAGPGIVGNRRRERTRADPLNAGLCESFPDAGHAAPGRVAAEPATRTAQGTSAGSSVTDSGRHRAPADTACLDRHAGSGGSCVRRASRSSGSPRRRVSSVGSGFAEARISSGPARALNRRPPPSQPAPPARPAPRPGTCRRSTAPRH